MPIEVRDHDTPLRARGAAAAADAHSRIAHRLDVEALLPRLPARQRDAVQSVLAHKSLAAVAQAEGVSLASMRRRLQRGVQRLQRWLAESE